MAISASFHRNVLLLSQVIQPSDELKKYFREVVFFNRKSVCLQCVCLFLYYHYIVYHNVFIHRGCLTNPTQQVFYTFHIIY